MLHGSQWAGVLPRLTGDFAEMRNQLFCFKPWRFRGCLSMWHSLAWLMDSPFAYPLVSMTGRTTTVCTLFKPILTVYPRLLFFE